jgi:hypothetical protein
MQPIGASADTRNGIPYSVRRLNNVLLSSLVILFLAPRSGFLYFALAPFVEALASARIVGFKDGKYWLKVNSDGNVLNIACRLTLRIKALSA